MWTLRLLSIWPWIFRQCTCHPRVPRAGVMRQWTAASDGRFFFPPASFNCINRLSTTSIYIFGTSLASFCWFLSPIWFFIWSFRSKSHRKTNIIQTVSLLFFMRPHEIAWENKASTEQRNNTYPVPDEISPPWWPTKNKCPDGWLPPNLNGKTN